MLCFSNILSHFRIVLSIVFHSNPCKPANLFLRFFKEDALAQSGVELHKLNLAFGRLSILASPNNVVGFC